MKFFKALISTNQKTKLQSSQEITKIKENDHKNNEQVKMYKCGSFL